MPRPTPVTALLRRDAPKGFAPLQAAFAAALLDGGMAVPSGLIGPDDLPGPRRFAVYRNNVAVGLIEALRAAYPVVNRLVGDAFFTAMARIHALANPPASPVMLEYGAEFPGFIAGFGPAAGLPYLADVARLERAWVEAYHAAEAVPLSASALAGPGPQELPSLRLVLHPSLRLLRSDFPVVAIWQANLGDTAAGAIDLADGGDDMLVARPDADVEVRRLPPGAAVFILALLAGAPVFAATREALSASPDFDLAGALSGLVETGMIVGMATEDAAVQP